MKTEYTPGPWKIATVHAEPYINIESASNQDTVCFVDASFKHQQANARLIAAAPDLLEALQELLNDKYLSDPINADRMERARAAIAKATQ